MRVAVLKERREGEARVAATPETARKLIGLGATVAMESGAGSAAGLPDALFREAGAEVTPDAASALSGAGIVLKVRAPLAAGEGELDELALIPRGALLLGTLDALGNDGERARAYAAAGVDAASMELLPRITRAQSMDVLSSQANLAGYRAVVEGAAAFDRGFPMLMTAAGTIPAAVVLVLGAGVAGLQAIATARRLGGRVSASDVRPAAKEEIKSLGAAFVGVEDEETAAAQTAGGYAKQMSEGYLRKQAEVVGAAAAKSDVVVCTALVQGRRAPTLLTEAMVASMKPGSVVVDIAADAGGNCAATVPGELVTTSNGVKVLGFRNWPGRIPAAASALYSRNLLTFLSTFWNKDAGRPTLPADDEIVRGVLLTRGGQIVHPRLQPEGVPA